MGLSEYRIRADYHLMRFKTYEEYLDSMITSEDLTYLRSRATSRTVAELGYRCTGEILDKQTFYKRMYAVTEATQPSRMSHMPASAEQVNLDNLQKELAMREVANMNGILATIIFLRQYTKTGFEVSSYIDFADRLRSEDWRPFFGGKVQLWPRPADLAYYHWRTGKSYYNSTPNYKVLLDEDEGLMFQNNYDRKLIVVDPISMKANQHCDSYNVVRTRVFCDKYLHLILYDHVIRRRC